MNHLFIEDDSLWVSGNNNSNYQLGLGHNQPLTQIPSPIPSFTSEKIKKISILEKSTVFLTGKCHLCVCACLCHLCVCACLFDVVVYWLTCVHTFFNDRKWKCLCMWY